MKRYLFFLLWIFFPSLVVAQTAPGGINTGTVRGYKADMFEGNFASTNLFGTGTTNAAPKVWGYTGTLVGREFVTQRGDYYGMEYNGILEVPQTGNYTFQLTNVDDVGELYLSTDGGTTYSLVVSRTCCGTSVTASRNLTAGDVRIRVKYIEINGVDGMGITWSGPGLTGTQTLDGRFVRVDNASLSHWYKADQTNSPTFSNYLNKMLNQANGFSGNDLEYRGTGSTTNSNLVNYNTAIQYDGDDYFYSRQTSGYSSNGLAFQNAPFQAFNVANFYTNLSANQLQWGAGYSCTNGNVIGANKLSSTSVANVVWGLDLAQTANFYTGEPKTTESYAELISGNSASRNVIRGIRSNSSLFSTIQNTDLNGIYINTGGIQYGGICGLNVNAAHMPEFIYYPFKLTDAQSQKVNTYLAVKYGTTLSAGNYVATNDAVVWNATTNALYNNRVFGIARDDAEGLNQKQSQSRMRPSDNLSSEFLKISKGTLQTTNAANTGSLPNNTYLLVGDDNTSLAASGTNLIVNGDFLGTTHWYTSGNLAAGTSGPLYFNGGDLTPNGVVYQDINTVAGQSYTLTFRSGTNGGNAGSVGVKAEVLNGTTVLATLSKVYSLGQSSNETLAFTATGTVTRIRFTDISTSTGGIDVFLDRVSIISPTSVDIPSSINNGSCAYERLTREWKAAVTGTPGSVTIVAGSTDTGSFRFLKSMTGITLMVDADGDGNFNTGTIRQYPYATLANGVATFNNVDLNNGEVFSFVWKKTSPGGVSSGLQHWLKADDGTAAGNLTAWNDQSGNGINMTASSDPAIVSNGLNYNPIMDFDGNDYFFLSSNFTSTFTAAEVFALGKSFSNNAQRGHMYVYGGSAQGGSHYTWSDGTIIEHFGTNDRIAYNPSTSAITDAKTGISSIAFNYSALDWNLHNVYSATNNWGINVNARNLVNTSTNTVSFTKFDANILIGATPNYIFYGQMPEVFLYNRVLTAAERNKVNTYMAIKYSQSLDQTTANNYTSSQNTTLWNATTNASFKNHIFGIGRDDCSGLDQRQSYSNLWNTQTNVRFGLGTINESGNTSNTTAFTADQQFLIMGALLTGSAGYFSQNSSTGIPTAYSSISCNPKRWNQAYKVANTGSVAPVQIKIGASAFGFRVTKAMTNIQLVVDTDGDNNLTTGSQVLYPAASRKGNEVVFNNVALPDGATWTLLWTEAVPGGVINPTTGTTISGSTYVNGLDYKWYTGTLAQYPATLDLNPLSVLPGTLQSSGYVNGPANIAELGTSRVANYFGIELTGKIFIPTTSATWQLKGVGIDDGLNVKINGVSVLNRQCCGDVTSANINLTSGYHDIVIRYSNQDGGRVMNLQWNGGSGSTFTAIPDVNFFTRPTGPSAWYASDDSSFADFADGATITANSVWYDQSVYGNNVKSINNPLYYSTTQSKLRNFNEIVEQTNDRFTDNTTSPPNGFAFGKQASTMFVSGSIQPATTQIFGYGHPNLGNSFRGLWATASTTNLLYWTSGNDYSANNYFVPNNGVFDVGLIGVISNNNNIVATNNVSVFKLGKLFSTGQIATPANQYTVIDSGPNVIQLGGRFDGTGMNGSLYETIAYPWALSAIEQQKVNSYLSIKWGYTLDQTTATNYLASDGTVIWNATAKATYKNDITGIGRDDCGALEQLQSASTDGSDIATIGRGGIATSNTLNTNSFATDKSFIVFGHDNGIITNLSTTNMPAVFTSQELACYSRLGRVWQAQVTGTPGTVSMQMGKAGVFTFNKTFYKPKLMVSNSATDWTNATIYDGIVTNGIAQFDNVTLAEGQFFTVGIINAAPGGVTTNLNLWLDATDGTSTTTDNTVLSTWNDLSLQSMNGTGVNSPLYRSGSSTVAANFNPVVSFNGTSNYFNLPTGFNDFTAGLTSFAVLNTNFGTVQTWGRILHLSTGGNANGITFNRNLNTNNLYVDTFNGSGTTFGSLSTTSNPLLPANGFGVYGVRIGSGTSGQSGRSGDIFVNGISSINSSSLTAPITISRTLNRVGYGNGSELINGYMPEVILYNRDLTSAERLRIHSYLAVKYGKTLDASVGSYKNSLGNDIYAYTTYWNRITGIGRDDCQGLEQLQSKSVETGALVTVSNGSSIFADNAGNTNTFANHNSWFVFGDNNKNLLWSGVDIPVASENVRLNRVWRAKETGTVGTVFLQVPDNSSTLTTKLPAESTKVYLLVANSATTGKFNSTTGVTEVQMTLNGTNWEVTYDFADGDYFTFSTEKLCIAPGGISDGATTWYRTDNKTNGAIAATSGTIIDELGNHTLTRNANGTATVVAGSASSFNYNKSITLATNAAFTKGSLAETSVINPSEGTMYGVGTSSNSLFMLSNNTTNFAGINGQPRFMAGTAGAFTNNTQPNIFRMNIGSSTLSGVQNGTAVSTGAVATSLATASTYTLGLGTYPAGATFQNGSFAEALSYNRALTTVESQIVSTIMAIKYGQTLSHNYFHPQYDGSNASTYTLYDVSTYGNRVFGVGRDDISCYSQNQSTSQLTGSMLKISVDGILNAENSRDKMKFNADRAYLIMGDDNGTVTWIDGGTSGNKEKPYAYSVSNCWDKRINRQWKVTNTNLDTGTLITIPSVSSTATTKLSALPTSAPAGNQYEVVMLVNDNPNFAINANQKEVEMTLNTTTNEYETTYLFPKDKTVYVTFAVRLSKCGVRCLQTNRNVKR